MTNYISNSFNQCHRYIYTSNYLVAAAIPITIGLISGVVMTIFTMQKDIKEMNGSSQKSEGWFGVFAAIGITFIAAVHSGQQGLIGGIAATVISGLAIVTLKLTPPRTLIAT